MQLAESARRPLPRHPRATRKTNKKEDSTHEQSSFQRDPAQNPPQRHGAAVKAFRIAEYFCERADRKNLRAKKREDHAKNHRVNIQNHARRNLPLPWQQPKDEKESDDQQSRTGEKEQPVWRVHQHEAQASPAVTKAAQMRRTPALVGPKNNRDFCNPSADLRSLDNHFQRKLHTGAAHIQAIVQSP